MEPDFRSQEKGARLDRAARVLLAAMEPDFRSQEKLPSRRQPGGRS